MSIISRSPFHDETAAFEYLEKTLWPEGPVCPHCGVMGNATKLQGAATRIGVWKCKEKACRKQFTVRVGTVFEHGRIPLHKMLQATYLSVPAHPDQRFRIDPDQWFRLIPITDSGRSRSVCGEV